MTHGSAGTFDVQLPLSGGTGIECRNTGGGMMFVFTFDQPVVSGTAAVTTGIASVHGTPAFSTTNTTLLPSQMAVTLYGSASSAAVPNENLLTVTVSNVANSSGQTSTAAATARVLLGDVNANGLVTNADVIAIRAFVATATAVTGATFRCDLNIDGYLTNTDVIAATQQTASGAYMTGGSTYDTAPTITDVSTSQTAISGVASSPAGFTVGDAESSPATLGVVATSNNQAVIPNANITISGVGPNLTVSVTPVSGLTTASTVTITMQASDGIMLSSAVTFTVSVTPAPTTYLATLSPVAGTTSLGTGTATLVVDWTGTFATLTYSVSNLSGNDSDDTINSGINGPFTTNTLLLDLAAKGGATNYLWTFKAGGGASQVTVANTLASIQANTANILIESSAFPAGELQGIFQLVTGSQTFVAPSTPASYIASNPLSTADASRFMAQAAFGGQTTEINNLATAGASTGAAALTGTSGWLTTQFATAPPIAYPSGTTNPYTYTTNGSASPIYYGAYAANANQATAVYSSSSMYNWIYNRVCTAQAPNAYGDAMSDAMLHQAWYRNAVTGNDQLRQRVATALSEICVVSQVDDNIDGNVMGLASYYDMLANDAFANFRTILQDVTLHPCMGEYLNMAGNVKASGTTSPNENYAREIMQLFSIGLYMLQPDGTLMLDVNSQPIPTYTQSTITNFAAVYTGWNYPTYVTVPTLPQPTSGNPVVVNDNSYYQLPMVLNPANGSNHSSVAKTLLSYTGAPSFPGQGTSSYIPAAAAMTATLANTELNFALDDIFYHPNVGPFICKQLIQRLVESNPSPAYVYRVASVFADDGTGYHVRGNMQAVIQAILTDNEARTVNLNSNPGYGHEREPIVRIANMLRPLHAQSITNKWQLGFTNSTLAQTIFYSPTVFNFFTPTYSQPGAVQQAGLAAPEMQIIYETTIVNAANMLYNGVYSCNYTNSTTTGGTTTNYGSPILTGTTTNTATAATSTSSTWTITVPGTYYVGESVTLAGFTPIAYNVSVTVASIVAGGFTATKSGNPGAASVEGTATANSQNGRVGMRGDGEGYDAYLDFSSGTGCGLYTIAAANGASGNVAALVDQVGLLLMSTTGASGVNPMDNGDSNHTLRNAAINYINANYPSSTNTPAQFINQCEAAVYLIGSSDQCSVQK